MNLFLTQLGNEFMEFLETEMVFVNSPSRAATEEIQEREIIRNFPYLFNVSDFLRVLMIVQFLRFVLRPLVSSRSFMHGKNHRMG